MACWALGAAAEHAAQRESPEHSLSAGLKGWSVNGPKSSKGRLERAGYPIHLNAKPGGHRLSILEPRAAKRGKRTRAVVRLREAARRKERTPRTRQTTSRREPSEQKGQP